MPFGLDDMMIATVGSSLVSGLLGSSSSKKAAAAQQAAAEAATAEQRRQFDLMREDTAPYRQVGSASINRLGGLYGLQGYDAVDPTQALEQTPGYQFRLGQGNQALDRFQAAKRITGGRAVKEALRYNQDYASGEYGNYLQGLFNLTGQGQGAVNTATNAGQVSANNIGQYQLGAGNAQAQGYLGSAGAINNAIQGGLQNYMTLSMYNDLAGRFKPSASTNINTWRPSPLSLGSGTLYGG